MSSTRECRVCKATKAITEFYKTGRKKSTNPEERHNECKTCAIARVKRNHDPVRARDLHLQRKYGITLNEWNELFAQQNHCCATCFRTEPGGKHNQWNTDHCHDSGIVRALLCHHCNTTLGQAKENPLAFENLAKYIYKFHWTKNEPKQGTAE